MKRVVKALLITILAIVGLFLTVGIVIWISSPGRLDSLRDASGKPIVGSLVEKNFVEIGGIQQGFFIRSENPENPVLLFLHGGPGSPELPLQIPTESAERLEKYFTVCYWEQRGAGISFSESLDVATMTVAQMVEDTRQMTEYLKERFKQEKIYLMGHSWGSYLGVKVIEKYPENYKAYMGIGQISNQLESEKLAFDYLMEFATEKADRVILEKLQRYNTATMDFASTEYLMTVRMEMNKLGVGIKHQDFSMGDMLKSIMLFKGYTLTEKMNYAQGSLLSLRLFENIIEDNLFESSVSFELPVYIVQGKYDYVTSYVLAQEYVDKIDAPAKGFFTFENSAHSPNLEEPEKFMQVVREAFLVHGNE